jgi:uncharacterized membrane protein
MLERNPRSTAKIAGHPIHPMLVGFPIAFLVGTLVCDLVYLNGGNPGWATGALWMVGAGVTTALVAAVFGFIDFLGDERVRYLGDAWRHMIGNLTAVTLAAISWILRVTQGAEEAVMPWGLTLSVAVALILGYTGWKGGELVFRHRVAVREASDETAPLTSTVRQTERIERIER